MPSSLGPAEILVILVVALIVLGPNRLPEAGRQVGRALAEVRKWTQGVQSELRDAIETEPPRAPAPASVAPTPTGPATPAVPSPVRPARGTAEERASILPPPEPPVVATPTGSDNAPADAPPTPSGEGTVGEPPA